MRISKRQLVEMIRKEKRKLLKENGVGIGFSNWEVNRNPNFAKAYGKDAIVAGLDYTGSRSARQNRLHEADIQGAEERADSALGELLDGYLDQHLDLSGSNREEALGLAYQDLLNFCDGVIEMSKEAEVNPEYAWADEDADDWSRRGPPR